MTRHTLPILAMLLLGLTACSTPPITDWTANEAVNKLTLDDASRDYSVFFRPRSDRLVYGEAARLARLVATGEITARDRITVSPAGPPALAARRTATIAAELLRYGITVAAAPLAPVPRDSAIIAVNRYLVTLPPCPNWSKPAEADFTNMHGSNFGCATATDLGEMLANPADLANGRPLGPAEAGPAVAAVQRYLNDKNALPTENAGLPVAGSSTGTPPGANTSSSSSSGTGGS